MKKLLQILCLTISFISSPVLYAQQTQSRITFKDPQTTVQKKFIYTSNIRLLNRFEDNKNLFSQDYLSRLNMSNQEQFKQMYDKPWVSRGKLFSEIFLGIVGNVAFGIAGGAIGSQLIEEGNGDALIPRGVLLGFLTGSAFGSALGVYIAGNSKHVKGSFGKALLGGFLGEGAAVLVLFASQSGEAGLISLLILPPICSALMFNKSLRYRESLVTPAFLNFNEGDFKMGIPYVHIHAIPGYKKNDKPTIGFNVTLLSIEL